MSGEAGLPAIYWYPDEEGTLETLGFGEPLSGLDYQRSSERVDAKAGDGTSHTSMLGSTGMLRIVLERFGPRGASDLERQLQTLEAHILAGGWIGFSRDHAKSWAAIAGVGAVGVRRGDTTIPNGGNGFTSWSAIAALASGDEIVIEGGAPDWRWELTTAAAAVLYTATDVSLTNPLRYTYTDNLADIAPVLRWRDFYPRLQLPAENARKPRITHDRRQNFTLELNLEYSVAATSALWANGAGAYGLGRFDGVLGLRDGTGISTWLGAEASTRPYGSGGTGATAYR